MKIQVLYFEGCPNHQSTVALVREVVTGLGLSAEVEEIAVNTQTEAGRLRFLGSPTVQVNGIDIEPSARDRTHYALSCRMYYGMGCGRGRSLPGRYGSHHAGLTPRLTWG